VIKAYPGVPVWGDPTKEKMCPDMHAIDGHILDEWKDLIKRK